MSDTPRTDANTFASPYIVAGGEATAYEMVDANFCREMERQNTALQKRVEELELENATLRQKVGDLDGFARHLSQASCRCQICAADLFENRHGPSCMVGKAQKFLGQNVTIKAWS